MKKDPSIMLNDEDTPGYSNVPLDIEGGDGDKTVGEAEKTFIQWRKRFIIIPGRHRFPYLTLGTNESE